MRHTYLALLIILAALPVKALAWGATGHRLISRVAVGALPDELPGFLKTPDSLALVGELAREPDRSKGSGLSHDRNRNPGHYLNLGDTGKVADALDLVPLPATREHYARALGRHELSEYQVGYLPYSIIDGWQQLRKDFAYWRALTAAQKLATRAEEHAWFEQDRRLREWLILRDLGDWSHYIADASQPMHVSTHFNGWGDYPNPEGFSQSKATHAQFEGAYVALNVSEAELAHALLPLVDRDCAIEARTQAYLIEGNRQILPLYRLEKEGAFKIGQQSGKPFVLTRLAAAASELRDLTVAAWRCSAESAIGYPPVPVKDVESGKSNPYRHLRGFD